MHIYQKPAGTIRRAMTGRLTAHEMMELEKIKNNIIDIRKYDVLSQEYLKRAKKIPLSLVNEIIPQSSMSDIKDSYIHAIEIQLDVSTYDIITRVEDLFCIREAGLLEKAV